ncbi:MAG: GrpB family protein [Burkholderiales bacterium]|nr:GrpB family protein [Burkholderiales bacterium]
MSPLASSEDAQERAIREPIRLVPYQEDWPASYLTERERLLSLFAPDLRAVEHIGSTAIPRMPAKPVVDLLAGVDSMAVADTLFEQVLLHGYTTSRAFNEMLPDRRWFMRSINGRRTHHLHLVVFGSPTWLKHLLFRDRLRSNGELAQSYAHLKSELAARFEHDREAYTDAKSEFVASVLAVA